MSTIKHPGDSGGTLTPRRTITRPRAAMLAGVTFGVTGAALVALPSAQAIDSNPPTGPGNVEIFTKRDMVAIEGYGEYAGKTAEITVTRNGTVIGSARHLVDGTGFMEVNHPGGACWGDGTSIKVTPDIKGGDEVRVDFLNTGGKWDGATAQDVEITDVIPDNGPDTLTINGRYGAGVDMPNLADLAADPGKFAVEIVNPDMRGGTSGIGARAIGWPVEAGEATTGYTVDGTIDGTEAAGGTFSVTFDFQNQTDLDLAHAGEHVAQAWQANDPNPLIEGMYGLTMYENGESAGPGFGGCPAGPQGMRADSPTEFTGKGAGADTGGIDVTWDKATLAPEAPAITGYSVRAVDDNGNEVGKRVGADARDAQLRGLQDGGIYTVEIATRSSNGESSPVSSMRLKAGEHIVPDAVARTARQPYEDGKYFPLITNENGDFGVHLDPIAGLMDAEVHYTVDGSTPTLTSPTFISGVDDSLQILQDTTIKWIVVDSGNIRGPVNSKTFDIVEASDLPPTITKVEAAPLSGTIDVAFTKMEGANTYRVQAYTGDSVDVATGVRVGKPVAITQPTDTSVTEVVRRMTGFTNGTSYKFTVAARYGTAWSVESELSAAVAPEAGSRADAGPDQTVLRGRQFTLDGSPSPKATRYQWTQIRPTQVNNGGFPQDPAFDLNPSQPGIQLSTGWVTKPDVSLRFPLLTTPTSDHNLRFRLSTEHTDGTTKHDLVDIFGQADFITAEENRWRTGDDVGGTGSQENATLTILNGSETGAVIGQAIVTNGQWTYAGGTPGLLNSRVYVWSDYGFTGLITMTN